MSEEVIKYQRSGHAERGFFCGDRVRITTGPDAGMIGTVKDVGSQLLRVDFVKFEGHCPGSILELMPPAPAPEATAAPDEAQTVPWSVVDEARKDRYVADRARDEWMARAEKAEAQLEATRRSEEATEARAESLKAENAHLRECLAKFTDGGMSGAEARAAKADERARFERETAARLLAALVTRGAPHIGQKETEPLLSLAKQMADHYFPAKERTS